MLNPRPFAFRIIALCLFPIAFCLRSPTPAAGPAPEKGDGQISRGIVQLLAIGPGAGEKKYECAATGFLVNDEGYILTNAHVVEDARRCLAASPGAKILAKFGPGDGRTVEAVACDVVAVDDDHDLALLKTESPLPDAQNRTFLSLNPDSVSVGTRVTITGYPSFTWAPKTIKGKVIARQFLALSDQTRRRIEVLILDVPLRRGASGSPVCLESGEVVGVVERQRPSNRDETVAVPTSNAIAFLARHGIRWAPGPDGEPRK